MNFKQKLFVSVGVVIAVASYIAYAIISPSRESHANKNGNMQS